MINLFTIRRRRDDGTYDYGSLWSTRAGAELEAEHNADRGFPDYHVVDLREVDPSLTAAKAVLAAAPADVTQPRDRPLNPKAVEALVRFFHDYSPSLEYPFNRLCAALNADPTADRDTLEMAIRAALTKESE